MADLEKRIDAVLTDAKAEELRPPHGRKRSPRTKPMKPQSVKRRWREYDANVREAARNAAAASRPSNWPEGYPEPPRGFGWVAPDYCKYPDGYCDYPCERCKGGGKRRHAQARPGWKDGAWKLNPGWKWASWDSAYYAGPVLSATVTMIGDKFMLTVWKAHTKVQEHDYSYPISAMNAAEEMGVKGGAGGKRRKAIATKVGPRGGRTEIQSLLFPVKLWTETRAKAWAQKNDFRYGDVDVTDNYIRLRQFEPERFGRMRTKCLMRRGGKCVIKAIVGVR